MSKQRAKDHEVFECDNEDCREELAHWHPVCPRCRRGRMYVQVSETRPLKANAKDPYPEILDED